MEVSRLQIPSTCFCIINESAVRDFIQVCWRVPIVLSLLVCPPQPIDYEGFQLFMATYLENDIPEELCQHLFTSFKSKTGGCSPDPSPAGTSLLGRLSCTLIF